MRLNKFALLAVALAFSVSAFAAAPLAPGTTLSNPDIGAGTFFTSGSLTTLYPSMSLIASLTVPMVELVGFEGLKGTATSNVYEDTSFAVGSRPLAFEYIFDPSSAATTDLDRAALKGWAAVAISDAGSDDGGTSAVPAGPTTWTDGDPHSIDRDSAPGPGLTLQWHVGSDGTELVPDTVATDYISAATWFVTNSLVYSRSTAGLQDSGAVSGVAILAPVPEPTTLALLGLAAVAGLAIRRKMA